MISIELLGYIIVRVVDNLPAHIQKSGSKANTHANEWAILNKLYLKFCEKDIKWLLHPHWINLTCLDIELSRAIRTQILISNNGRSKRKQAERQQAVN